MRHCDLRQRAEPLSPYFSCYAMPLSEHCLHQLDETHLEVLDGAALRVLLAKPLEI